MPAPKAVISGEREEMIRPAMMANRKGTALSGMVTLPSYSSNPSPISSTSSSNALPVGDIVECAMCHLKFGIEETILVKVRRVCRPCHVVLLVYLLTST